jgi:hypothetical protein
MYPAYTYHIFWHVLLGDTLMCLIFVIYSHSKTNENLAKTIKVIQVQKRQL